MGLGDSMTLLGDGGSCCWAAVHLSRASWGVGPGLYDVGVKPTKAAAPCELEAPNVRYMAVDHRAAIETRRVTSHPSSQVCRCDPSSLSLLQTEKIHSDICNLPLDGDAARQVVSGMFSRESLQNAS